MGTITRIKTWAASETLTASDLNSEFNNILTTVNGSIQAANLGVTAGIAAASKALVLDANRDLDDGTAGNRIRNLSIAGDGIVAGSLSVTGQINPTTHIDMPDDANIKLGTSDDLQLYHDGSDSYITNATGALKLATATSGIVVTIGHTTSETTVADNLTVTGTTTATGGIELSHASANTLTASGGILSIESVAIPTISSTDTLTNKTITSPTINTPTITGNTTFSDGSYNFNIASHDGTNGLSLAGTVVTSSAAELNILDGVTTTTAEINLIDGGTARGTTAVASGDGILINDGGTMRMTNVDTVSTYFASHSVGGTNIATVGTIGTGTWQGTAVTVPYGGTGATSLTDGGVLLGSGTGAVTAMAVLGDGEMIVGDGTTDPVAESGATLRTSIGVGTGNSPQFTGIELSHASENTLTASSGILSIEGVAIPTISSTHTLTNKTWNGGVIASAYLDADTAHLGVTQTFTGDKTFTGTVTVGVNGTGKDVRFYGDTSGSNLLWDESADDLIFTNAGIAVGSDATGDLYYRNASGFLARLGASTDGYVLTTGGAGTVPAWEAAPGAGSVDAANGASTRIATFTDADSLNGEANLTFNGSTLTITGSIDLSADIDVDGTLEADAITLGGTALGSLYSPIAGSSSIVTTGALNSGSITSGFGTINNGSSTITTTGALSAGATTVTSLNASDGNITNVGNIALDTISSDAGTTVSVTLGTDAGDDFIVGNNNALVVEGDNNRVGIGTASPLVPLHLKSASSDLPVIFIEDTNADANGPAVVFRKYGASPADNDAAGEIEWQAYNDAGTPESFSVAQVQALTTDVSDESEDGALLFKTMSGGTFAERMRISSANVGIGTTDPGTNLHVSNGGSAQAVAAPGMMITNSASSGDNVGLSLASGTAGKAYIYFGDSADDAAAQIWYDNNTDDLEFNAAESAGQLIFKTASTERMRITNTGSVGIGSDDVWGSLHIKKDSSNSVNVQQHTGDAAGPIYRLDKGRGSMASPAGVQSGDSLGKLEWTGWSTNVQRLTSAHIEVFANQNWSSGNGGSHMKFSTQANNAEDQTLALTINHDATIVAQTSVFLNETVNGKNTIGLTINQATNDNEIISLKSTGDVAHDCTDVAETDTFGTFTKLYGDQGGLQVTGFVDSGAQAALQLEGVTSHSTPQTGKTASNNGTVNISAYKVSSNDRAQLGSNENILSIYGASATRFIFDCDGDAYADSQWTTFDDHDDLVMLHDIEATMIPDLFGKAMKYDAPYLEKVGIIGEGSIRQENGKTRAMINTNRLQMLHHGAIRQVHQQLQDVKEFYEDKLAALEARLLRLEA